MFPPPFQSFVFPEEYQEPDSIFSTLPQQPDLIPVIEQIPVSPKKPDPPVSPKKPDPPVSPKKPDPPVDNTPVKPIVITPVKPIVTPPKPIIEVIKDYHPIDTGDKLEEVFVQQTADKLNKSIMIAGGITVFLLFINFVN